jgi:hypothetical protein
MRAGAFLRGLVPRAIQVISRHLPKYLVFPGMEADDVFDGFTKKGGRGVGGRREKKTGQDRFLGRLTPGAVTG